MAAPGQTPDRDAPEVGVPDLDALARDWVTLWQSELTAIASDREAQESWLAIMALWAGAAGAMLAGAPRSWPVPAQPTDARPNGAQRPGAATVDAQRSGGAHEPADRRSGRAAPPRAAPVAAAPDPRDVEIDRLARHVVDLESRLAELERGVRRGGGGHRRGGAGPGPRRQRS